MEGRNGSRPGRGIKDERDGDGSKKVVVELTGIWNNGAKSELGFCGCG